MTRARFYFSRIIFVLFLSLGLVLCCLPAVGHAVDLDGAVNVGLLIDNDNDKFVSLLEVEIENLLGRQFNIRLPQAKRYVTDWSVANVEASYLSLASDPVVDIIVAVGPLSSAVLSRHRTFPKPVILYGILDYDLQAVPLTKDKKSGIHNLTYVLDVHEFSAELDRFYEIFPYEKLTVIVDRNYSTLVPNLEPFLTTLTTLKGSQSRIVYYDGDIPSLLKQLPTDTDALFWGGLFSMPPAQKDQLIAYARSHNLPSYSYAGVVDVRRGTLAGSLLETNWQKVTRRVALNIERIFDGEDPATFPTLIDFSRRLTINMHTAVAIGFSPSWQTLARAEQIATEQVESSRTLSFKAAVQESLKVNLGLDIERQSVASAVEDIDQARAELLPALQLATSATQIDEDHAGAAQAERSVDGSLTLKQTLYSEPAYANLAVQKHNLESTREAYREVLLDTILNVGDQYLDILKAKANERIVRNNLALVRKNYEVAEYRKQIGYAGNADVYRLEAELANATSDLLAAQNVFKQAKISLNESLNRPIAEDFAVEDVVLDEKLMLRYGGHEIRTMVRNQKTLDQLTRFLVMESFETVPELGRLKQLLLAQERILKSRKRQRWLPDVALSASVQENFSESGSGTQLTPDEDSSWNVNALASWTLFEGGSIASEVRQTKVEISKLRKQLQDAGRQIELKLRKAVLNVRVLTADLKLSRLAVDAAAKNYALIQDAYRQGTVTITSLLDAQNSALAADQAAANAVYDYYAGILQLERSLGSFSVTSNAQELQDFLIRLQVFMAAQP